MNIIKITNKLVLEFAKKSGDFNPLHLDEKYSSRYLFGRRIAHGSLVLSLVLKKTTLSNDLITDLKCLFLKPIYINDYLNFETKNYKNFQSIIVRKKNKEKVIDILIKKKNQNFNYQKFSLKKANAKKKLISQIREEKDIIKNIGKVKKINLYLKKKKFLTVNKNLFYFILLVSKEIGMNYPGQRSLFLSCRFKLQNTLFKDSNFKILDFDKNLSSLIAEYNFGYYTCETKSLLLPNKKKIISTNKKLNLKLLKNSFFLVIGGSRGLGFLTTRILLNSGFNVTSTYFNNKDELIKLKKIFPSTLKIKKINILTKKDKRRILNILYKYDYIFYFSSCKILKTGQYFDKQYFNNLKLFYLNFLQFIIFNKNRLKSNCKVFFPSTIFLDDKFKKKQFSEYTKVKKEVENISEKFNKVHRKLFYNYRLKAFDTDQNYSFYQKKIKNDVYSYVNILKDFIK
jgi:hypothetical protein